MSAASNIGDLIWEYVRARQDLEKALEGVDYDAEYFLAWEYRRVEEAEAAIESEIRRLGTEP